MTMRARTAGCATGPRRMARAEPKPPVTKWGEKIARRISRPGWRRRVPRDPEAVRWFGVCGGRWRVAVGPRHWSSPRGHGLPGGRRIGLGAPDPHTISHRGALDENWKG